MLNQKMPINHHFSILITLMLIFLTPGTIFGVDYVNKLKEGNLRFVENKPRFNKLTFEERKNQASTQTPFATIVACSDSRVAPELLFDQGAGELFIVRLAGNTVDTFALASIEYGLNYLKTPLLVIMGHQDCGAVRAAFNIRDSSHSPELTKLLKNIEPAVKIAIKENPGKSQNELLDKAIKQNIRQTKQEILNNIPELKARIKNGQLQVENAMFFIDNGKVLWENEIK